MAFYDVFNGDADGLCALHQLRMANPRDAELVTGVKRDINLLKRLETVSDATITVLDISLDKNRSALLGLLNRGCSVLYFDHHFAGEIPQSDKLEAHIDPSPEVCTSLLVDRYLDGRYKTWAITAAYGDNLIESAEAAADHIGLDRDTRRTLRTLGELLNYNGYGHSLDDLHFAPAVLYQAVHAYDDPVAFFEKAPEARILLRGFEDDMANAERSAPIHESASGRVYRYPCAKWARRIMGVYANRVANEDRDRASALIVDNADGSLRISVRAPKNRPSGADTLCRAFPTGGGRAGAAGINALPADQLDAFLSKFDEVFAAHA